MNWQVLRDKKTIAYFLLSCISFIVAIIIAVKENKDWVVLIVIGNIFTLFAVFRAQKVIYQTKGEK